MFATLDNYNRGNLGILEKPAPVEMLLKCRERVCEFIEIRETECYEMRQESHESADKCNLSHRTAKQITCVAVFHFRLVRA